MTPRHVVPPRVQIPHHKQKKENKTFQTKRTYIDSNHIHVVNSNNCLHLPVIYYTMNRLSIRRVYKVEPGPYQEVHIHIDYI